MAYTAATLWPFNPAVMALIGNTIFPLRVGALDISVASSLMEEYNLPIDFRLNRNVRDMDSVCWKGDGARNNACIDGTEETAESDVDWGTKADAIQRVV